MLSTRPNEPKSSKRRSPSCGWARAATDGIHTLVERLVRLGSCEPVAVDDSRGQPVRDSGRASLYEFRYFSEQDTRIVLCFNATDF